MGCNHLENNRDITIMGINTRFRFIFYPLPK
jgi:hypothetical protein